VRIDEPPAPIRANSLGTGLVLKSNSAPSTPVTKTAPVRVEEQSVDTEEKDKQEEPAAKMDDRLKIVEELWDTERQYVSDLEVIVNMYLIPLRDVLKNRATIIHPSEIPKVFSNVETLLRLAKDKYFNNNDLV
jgi:hypothetical protein